MSINYSKREGKMQHEMVVRANAKSKHEVVVQLNLPDTFDKAEITESLVTCAFRHIIIRANDAGRTLMASDDYKSKKVTDADVSKKVQDKFNEMLNNQRYIFRTKGQQMSKVEKTTKNMTGMTDEELQEIIDNAEKMKKK